VEGQKTLALGSIRLLSYALFMAIFQIKRPLYGNAY
jgi:hypothetical protein